MRICEFDGWNDFAGYLDSRAELMENWLDGFESGVDDPRYSVDDDALTDQPWCTPWSWDPQSDRPTFSGGELDGFGRPTPDAVYDFAKAYAAGLRSDIVELLDEDEANKEEEEA